MMTDLSAFFAILAALTVGAVSPGPTFVQVCRISLAGHRSDGVAAALGAGLGGSLFATLALAGLTALLNSVEWLNLAFRILGGLYLVVLGVQIWRGAKATDPADPEDIVRPSSPLKAMLTTFLIQASNPKTAIVYGSVFAALLPQSVPVWMFIALPLAIGLMELVWYAIVALMLSSPRPRMAYLAFKPFIDRLAGFIMAALGLRLMIEALRSQRLFG